VRGGLARWRVTLVGGFLGSSNGWVAGDLTLALCRHICRSMPAARNPLFQTDGSRHKLKALRNSDIVSRYGEWLVCQRYSRTTREVYNRVAGKLFLFWGRRHFSKVSHLDIRDFLTEMSRRDLSTEVVHRYLWALRSFFDFLCLHGVVDEVAPRLVRPRPAQRPLPRALSEKNVSRLIRAAKNPRDRAILELFYATGCRITELMHARLEHVDFAKRTIIVNGKTGDRRVFFGLTAKRSLRAHLQGRKTGFLFESQYRVQKGCVSWNGTCWAGYWLDYTGGSGTPRNRCVALGPASMGLNRAWAKFRKLVPNPDRGHIRRKPHPLTRSCICQIFKEAAFRARIGRVTSHNLRHSFAAHMLDHGADIRHVQELLGHTSLASTNRYAQVVAAPIAGAYRRFHPRD
jgi:integrase/recombinase XerC